MSLPVDAKAQPETVVQYVRDYIIKPNFEVVEEFEILSTIRYDPHLGQALPSASNPGVDIGLDFLRNDTQVCPELPENILFNDFAPEGPEAAHDPLQELLHILDAPGRQLAPAGLPASAQRDLRATFKERFFLLKEHQQRLNLAMSYFDWDFEIPMSLLLDKLIEAVPLPDGAGALGLQQRMQQLLLGTMSYKMRVLISRSGNMRIEAHPLVRLPAPNDGQKYFINTLLSGFVNGPTWQVWVDSQPVVISPFTTFKTTRRQHYNDARTRVMQAAGMDKMEKTEVLVYNDAFQLMEGSITSVAVKKYIAANEYRYVTPFLASGCLCGVMRHFLLQKGLVQEDTIDVRHLKEGDEVLLFNAVMGCVKGVIRHSPLQS
ncbi:AGR330Wp [Eremothecium gossypii ATCC 10895]|uniref:AGR330Wp n=1 Tax=Eremothecium gossypii (strain ATCC 10895 / CBS 109.51 / FGSC 9923 / NRRL Y-1056) TaxID=284811 RepID=Q74Z76_EREGS|nr:AGR330Wp [Eremothecium gossypii ATCC 10895]AAS54820.1 AGR330Wp [Eremothecium gossypii ATCC 10895]AEY99152.1 FAGR330Wp [Eremothecium gossypii FDAG1]